MSHPDAASTSHDEMEFGAASAKIQPVDILANAEYKLLTFVLTKLTENEHAMIKGEQIGLADMLEDASIGYYSQQHEVLEN